ncbi:MAG: membrane protein insertion efficiency factor YidD [Porticoccaceae bacterium]|nr:membrane protein insertion efficiency factor YidD [Porticoccaceae bacterium]
MKAQREIMRKVATLLIRGYQLAISPMLGKNCRFEPTCSCYAHEAIERFGVLKGGYLSAIRIAKCNPFHPGGYDPLVDATNNNNTFN